MVKGQNIQKKNSEISPGTIRIKTRNLAPYEKTKKSWKKSSRSFPEAMVIIKLFKAHRNFHTLIDQKNPKFLKGQLSPQNKVQGARINILPNGKKLDKAYSLFARQLCIHNESSTSHWDVMYQNHGGTHAYLYTIEKKQRFIKKKYEVVNKFAKLYPTLRRRIYYALRDKKDEFAVPMYTLLKTYMRIGNEIYYKMNGHKGLTTLKKKDISIRERYVTFSYIGKDGVPTKIKSRFPNVYILRLQKRLKSIKETAFVFMSKATGDIFHDIHFKNAFKRYCGREFYPHIIRSYYATSRVQYFLRMHKHATKEDIRVLFIAIAEKLGHKRFDKKNHVWKENYNVTIRHYIKPALIKRVKAIV